MHKIIFLLAIITTVCFVSGSEVNLLERGAVLSGSSFQGTVDAPRVTVRTESYFTAVADGDPATGWRPMESRGPHWLQAEWRYPVKINRISWDALRVEKGILTMERNREIVKIAEFVGNKGELAFPEITTDNLRLEITEYSGSPVVFGWEAYGPEQPLAPAVLPEPAKGDERIVVENPSISGKEFRPGDTVEVSFDAVAPEKMKGDYYFIVEIREKGPSSYFRFHFGDFEVAGAAVSPAAATSAWVPGERMRIRAEFRLPYYAPAGMTGISVMAIRNDGKRQAGIPDNRLGNIDIIREKGRPVEEFPGASVAMRNGQHGFQIGSQFRLPFFNRYMSTSGFKRFFDSWSTGVDIQYFLLYSSCITRRSDWPAYLRRLDQQMMAVMRVAPESYFFIGLDLRASKAWRADNPGEMMVNAKGEMIREPGRDTGILSYGSEKYLQDCKDFIDLLLDYIKDRPYAGRVIGFHPWSCTKNDAFIGGLGDNSLVGDRSNILIGDYHPGAIRAFRAWLRKKYDNSAEALQKAWRDDKVDFDTAMPDTRNLTAEDFPRGVFRDPVKSRAAIDYVEFFPSLIGDFHRRIAAYIKERTNRRVLVMVHYGAIIHTLAGTQPSGARYHSTNYDFYNLLCDDNIDMYVQASPYNYRHSGDPVVIYQPIESLNIHNRVYLQDYDVRTISSGTLKHGRHRSQYETRALIRRDLAWLLTKNGGAWIADMSKAGWREWSEARRPWFSTPEAAGPIHDIVELFTRIKDMPRKPVAEIAVVLNMKSPRYEDVMNSAGLYRNLAVLLLREEITRLGAPYDTVLIEDLGNPNLRKDYKLYIFLNAFYLTPDERRAIEARKMNGAAFLWFYAPGYVSDAGLDVKGVRELTGMNIDIKKNRSELLQMTVGQTANPLAAKLQHMSFKAETHLSVKALHPEVINPVFYVKDAGAETLATYPDGLSAWAARDFGTWKSIYSAVPLLNVQALRNIAAYAGVHLYCEEDIVMAADSRMLVFNNGYGAARTINVKLPGVKTVTDAFSGEVVSRGKKNFSLTLDAPQTRILILEDDK